MNLNKKFIYFFEKYFFCKFVKKKINKMKENKLKSLVRLLDDPDENIYNIIEKNILDEGDKAIFPLEKLESYGNKLLENRIKNILININFSSTLNNFKIWTNSDEKNLLDALFLIAKINDKNIGFEKIKSEINKITNVFLEIYNGNLTPLLKVKLLNHIFFNIYSFFAKMENYKIPESFFINSILENKSGNVISLCILYSIISNILNIPVFCVKLPRNFFLIYKDKNNIFYINPLNKGTISGKKEVDIFIEEIKEKSRPEYFLPIKNDEIIYELLEVLIYSCEKSDNKKEANEFQKFQNLINLNKKHY